MAVIVFITVQPAKSRKLYVDTGDGVNFQIINVWSGLALDTLAGGTTAGTAIVQNTSSSSQTQHWAPTYQTHSPKRGQTSHSHFNFMFRPTWAYNWTHDSEDVFPHSQFMPMQWGAISSATPEILLNQPLWHGRANQTTVLGFNEPDVAIQSNITAENAAFMWPRLERMRLPLGGPVPASRLGAWRTTFEAIAEEQGLRSDYMTVHWYDSCNGGDPSNIITNLTTVYNTYQKPIWLTEFSTIDFSGTQTTWSRNDNYNWLAEFLWRAESLPWLKKYSLFEWGAEDNNADPTVNDSPRLALHLSNDAANPGYEDLSECGRLYAGWDGDTAVRNAKSYIIHNKATCLRLRAEAGAALDKADILSNDGPMLWTLAAAPSSRRYIQCVSDGRRLNFNGTTLSLVASTTTGTGVEWALDSFQHGWFYIRHVSTNRHLRITGAGVLGMVATTEETDNTRFRFIHIGGATKPTAANSLIAQWSLNETSGDVALDTTANSFDGDVVAAPTWAQSSGRQFMQFNGSDQYVRIASLPDLTQGFTIGLWAKSDTATWNDNGMLLTRQTNR
jgi:Glycosyl hydrolase catalytic core